MSEPVFRYHPDPLATGSAEFSVHECSVCRVQRSIRYRGPIYGERPDSLCLYCISSGQASQALRMTAIDSTLDADMPALFTDARDVPEDVPMTVVVEVTQRTPGFAGWQQPSWRYHCADGAAFLGPAGYADLEPHPDAVEEIREDLRRLGLDAQEAEDWLHRMDRRGQPTAYLFRCLYCGRHLASWDIG